MYERNAIVIDRYFSNIFGYDKKNNIKVNAYNYFELVDKLEQYQQASEIENNVMTEYDRIANMIKETQEIQQKLDNKTLKYFDKRRNLFENLDEDDENLKLEFEKIENEFKKNEEEVKLNSERFIDEIKEFNEKSEIRSKCGRQRRIIENDYQKMLNTTIENIKSISKEKLKEVKSFIKTENKEPIKITIKESILKNGAKEKVPFDSNVINKAIDTTLYIEEKKGEILLSLYEKTNKLFEEIKSDSIKVEKHKKQVKDSKSKLEFLNVITDYIILFLDNERMNTIGGEVEHSKIMNVACENLQKDLSEIQNMYSLLVKEINGKATKKTYKELYNIDYFNNLKEQENRFEKNISRLNMTGSVIYPDYWRIEGMQKIYDTFRNIMTDTYEIDLSEYEPLDITFEVNKKMLNNDVEIDDEERENNNEKDKKTSLLDEYKENSNNEKKSEVNIQNNIEEQETSVKQDVEDNKEIDDEEFHWDEEDENDELIFDINDNNSKYSEDNDEDEDEDEDIDEINIKETEDETERDKEIDELLGIFDSEETEEANDEIEEEHILQIEDDEIEDDIFSNDEDVIENKQKNKRKSLFGRRK